MFISVLQGVMQQRVDQVSGLRCAECLANANLSTERPDKSGNTMPVQSEASIPEDLPE